MSTVPNLLIHETSPYLLQHAYNPVQWHAWSQETLRKAVTENKPILVSIGYAACHWCHVMERESFEDVATAAVMNEFFINIKIDREERPDLDHIYMDALQTMTGSGGWPLNVFLTPEGKPFYGGTYFPPIKAHNRASWTDVLNGVHDAFVNRRDEINAQAEGLTQHIIDSNGFGLQQTNTSDLTRDMIADAKRNLLLQADKAWGGFGKAPKFPQSFSIQFLLREHSIGDHSSDDEGLKQALLSLDKMIAGGIYDQLGGGFVRYSTDTEWLAPHFEKMLYDNALLIQVLSEAFQLTGNVDYKKTIYECFEFIERELMSDQHAFYSALDADSEGEEGKFYVWSYAEVQQLLGDDADLFCDYYNVTPDGNWEGKNILRVLEKADIFAKKHGVREDFLHQLISRCKIILLPQRENRTRPQLDDKILLGWNALMNTACSKAYMATGDAHFRDLAISNMGFLLDNFYDPASNEYFHTWKNNKAKYPAFLDDGAYLIQSLVSLYEVTTEIKWLDKAAVLTHLIIDQYSEQDTGFFYFTKASQHDVILRKKEVYDGAVPSGNAIMALNLHHLGLLLNNREWTERSLNMVNALQNAIVKYPTSFGVWNCLLMEIISGTNEIALVGNHYQEYNKELINRYLPHKVLMSAKQGDENYPLLAGKNTGGETLIYLCRNYACLQPVSSVDELIALIDRPREPE